MDRRDALLDSAELLARSRGYDGFSYADLSDRVGIRKASIHHHFPSKMDLALALVGRYRERFEETLQEIAAREETAAGRLSAYLEVYRKALMGGSCLCLCVAFSAGRDSLADPVLRELNAFHTVSLAWLTATFALGKRDKTIRRITEPSSEAAACLALVEGGQLLARAALDPGHFDSAVAGLKARTG